MLDTMCYNMIFFADNSYFEKLIEQLQEVAGTQEEQESYKDDLVDVSGEEDAELNAETSVCFFFLPPFYWCWNLTIYFMLCFLLFSWTFPYC